MTIKPLRLPGTVLTWSEVMAPLAAAVHLVHCDAAQQLCIVGFFQTRHEHLAFGDFFGGHIQQLERCCRVNHPGHDCFGVLLDKKKN